MLRLVVASAHGHLQFHQSSVNKTVKLMPNRRQFAAGAASRTRELLYLNRLFATRLCGSDGITILFWNAKQDVIMKPLASGAMISIPAMPF